MKNNIPTETIDQIKSLSLKVNIPLIISDADEVLFLFLKGFEIRGRKKTIKNLRAITFPLHTDEKVIFWIYFSGNNSNFCPFPIYTASVVVYNLGCALEGPGGQPTSSDTAETK